MARQLFLVAYDVRHHRRLYRVHQILKGYACGGQRSAFECYLSTTEKQELISRIDHEIDKDKDAFLIIRLCSKNSVEILGKAVMPAEELYTYLG
jgi:CRISPR-associated protein Cas2